MFVTGAPTDTAPLTASGILNLATLGTTATLVVSGTVPNRLRRVKLTCVTSGRNISWATVANGAASPANKADGDGSVDEGAIIMGGGGASEWITIPGWMDLYLVASAASTAVQVIVVEH